MATARATLEERLARVREREALLEQERDRLTARLQVSERKRDTRRRILLGSLVLARLEESTELREFVARELPSFLARDEEGAVRRHRRAHSGWNRHGSYSTTQSRDERAEA